MTASDRSGRRTQQRKFFLKKRQDLQVLLRNREARGGRSGARTVRFLVPGLQLDLGGIGKGYAVDRVVVLLHD